MCTSILWKKILIILQQYFCEKNGVFCLENGRILKSPILLLEEITASE
jgi:hypothetical protein